MRGKLRSHEGGETYGRRKAIVEPVFGVLKQQRNLREFRTRGLERVGCEMTMATIAYNITRMSQKKVFRTENSKEERSSIRAEQTDHHINRTANRKNLPIHA